jgi:hypothetical protein
VKDIDFDELDRAVSSVLSPKTSEDTDATDDSVVTVNTSAPKPDTTETTTASDAEDIATPKISTPLAVKRRGKFMDMIHPSADMQPNTPKSTGAKSSPMTLAPLTPSLSKETEADTGQDTDTDPVALLEPTTEPTAAVDESKALIGAEPAPVETELPSMSRDDDLGIVSDTAASTEQLVADTSDGTAPASTSDYVDPLDVQSPSSATDDNVPADEPEPAPTEPTDTLSQPTPFLTDTKVDKRPLGAFGEAEAESPETPDTGDAAPSNDVQGAPVVPLPRELQPDVVEVESSQETEESQAETTDTAPVSPFAANVAATGPVSDGRVEGHPLFDTSTYHEPIAAVHAKSTPVWVWWLIGLAVCLGLGAGVGYFLFTAGL